MVRRTALVSCLWLLAGGVELNFSAAGGGKPRPYDPIPATETLLPGTGMLAAGGGKPRPYDRTDVSTMRGAAPDVPAEDWGASDHSEVQNVGAGLAPARRQDAESAREQAEAFYASRPREERPVAGWQEVPAGLRSLSAASCGECHRAIYEEWRVSTHAQAWTDRQFQAERRKSGNRWLCNNCHTPLLNQMERWAVAVEEGDVERPLYVENALFDPVLRAEGITCSGCHVRDGVVEGPTGRATEAHPTRRAERFAGSEICLACHQAVRFYEGKSFVCVFETGREWREGPYGPAGSNQPCLSCHMPPVTRPLAEGGPPRTARHHDWPGAGIYKVEGFGPPRDRLGPGLAVAAEPRADGLRIEYGNAAAGHMLPTGDPERFIEIEVELVDANGAPVGSWRERIGQTWKWWPEAKKLADNRLAPLETREAIVGRPPGAVSWRLTATSHRISREAIEYHELEGYPASRVTHRLDGAFPTE